jgi:hypothetical protein
MMRATKEARCCMGQDRGQGGLQWGGGVPWGKSWSSHYVWCGL